MLKFLGRLERTRSLIIVLFAGLMVVSLVLFFGAPQSNQAIDPAISLEVLAEVGSEEITVADLSRLKESYANLFGGQFNVAQLGGDRRLLDGLIRDRLISQEAARLGLGVSEAEVASKIYKDWKDASGKFVGLDRYKESVGQRYGSIERYETQVKNDLAAEKLRAFITASVTASDEEVKSDYQRKNTSFDLTYIYVSADKLAKKLQPTDDELKTYFEAHKDEYRILVPQKKIRYIFVEQEKAGAKIPIPEAELKTEYDNVKPEFKQAGVKVQVIVLKVARADLDATVKQKADDLVKQAKGTANTATEAAFGELAKGNSEDPTTAKAGGRVTGVVKKNANKPNDPYQRALTMQEGEVSEPIKFGSAYYIIRRGESVPKTFELAKPELLVSLRNRKSYAVASQLAQKIADRLKTTKNVQQVAQEFAGQANMTAGEMVRETPFIKPADDVPNIGSSPQFEGAIEPLKNINDVGDRVSIKDGFAIPMLIDQKEPRVPELSEVKEKVAEAVKNERAKSQLEQTARDLAKGLAMAADMKAAAEKLGLEAKSQEAFKIGTTLGEAGSTAQIDDAIYKMKAGDILKEPLKTGDGWVIIAATKRTDADLAEYAKQRSQLTESSLSSRRAQVFDDYISAVMARMKREGKIKVYEDVLKSLAPDEPQIPGQIPGQFPIQP